MQTKFFVATDLDLENVFVFICEMLRIDSVDRVCVGLCATRACMSVRASTAVRLAIYQQTGSICVTISLWKHKNRSRGIQRVARVETPIQFINITYVDICIIH